MLVETLSDPPFQQNIACLYGLRCELVNPSAQSKLVFCDHFNPIHRFFSASSNPVPILPSYVFTYLQMPHESTVDHYNPNPVFEEHQKSMTMMSPAGQRKRNQSSLSAGTHNQPHKKDVLAMAPDPVELTHGHDDDE